MPRQMLKSKIHGAAALLVGEGDKVIVATDADYDERDREVPGQLGTGEGLAGASHSDWALGR